MAITLAKSGRVEDALAVLRGEKGTILSRVLKYEHLLVMSEMLVLLRQAIH